MSRKRPAPRPMARLTPLAVCAALAIAGPSLAAWTSAHAAQRVATAALRIEVVADADGKPVSHALVIVKHSNPAATAATDRAVRTAFELETNQNGGAVAQAVPVGPFTVEVTAAGFATFSQVYDQGRSGQALTIRLRRP